LTGTLFAKLCAPGGRPDAVTLSMEICSKTDREWIVDICFDEGIHEISECEPTQDERCGKFTIRFDANGVPEAIGLLHPM
jgi:hypothetical protein